MIIVGCVRFDFIDANALLDMGSELPEGERRKFAAKAVSDIMREL